MDRAPARLIQERSGRETEGPGAQRLPSSLCFSVALCSIKKRRSTKEFSFWRTPIVAHNQFRQRPIGVVGSARSAL